MRERLTGRSDYVILAAFILLALMHVMSGIAYATDDNEKADPRIAVGGFEFRGNETISDDTLADLLRNDSRLRDDAAILHLASLQPGDMSFRETCRHYTALNAGYGGG